LAGDFEAAGAGAVILTLNRFLIVGMADVDMAAVYAVADHAVPPLQGMLPYQISRLLINNPETARY
jgi:hypothetical protein